MVSWDLIGPLIPLMEMAAAAAFFALLWAVRCCWNDCAKEGGGGASATGNDEGPLDETKDVVIVVPEPGGAGEQRGPDPGEDGADGDVELCAICAAPVADAGWGPPRRLRPCGHVYHADCIDLWLQRMWTCPLCRAGVAVSPAEILDLMV